MTFNSIISKYFFVFIICILYVGNVLSYDTNDDSTKKFINVIHAELDSDKDGQVDKNEAKKLTDLNDNAKSYNSEKVFSQSLNRDILWRSWKQSESYTWTKEIVVLWLTYDIKLPEYEKTFLHHNINGTSVPRLALPDYCYLQQVLLIRSNAHCQRIATKAKNLILFGASREFQRQFPMKDLTAYSIISSLHSQLDDDKDGGVDPDEADEFVRDELKYTSDFDRAKKFNKDDNHISKEDLWRNWKSSEVYNWTEDDVVNWLCDHVDLCEHTVNFKSHHIDGSMIPSLAQSDVSNLFKDLKIRNPVHRKKIILKATDLILFGPPKKTQSRAKDSILLTLVLLTITGCCLAYSQNKYSKQQIQALQHQMKELGYAEDSLTTLQNKLDEAEKLTDKMTTEKIEIEEKLRTEIEKYKEDLCNTESQEYLKNDGTNDDQSTSQAGDFSMSEQLRLILQISYEVEGSFFFYKRNAAIKQMDCVKEMCEKLRKKKNTVIGAFRIAHSGLFDDMEKDLSDARTSIDQIKSDLLERSHRWQMIEKLTNFQLIPTPGLSKLRTDLATLIAEDGSSLKRIGTSVVGGPVLSTASTIVAASSVLSHSPSSPDMFLAAISRPSVHQLTNGNSSTDPGGDGPICCQSGPSMPKVWSVSSNLAHLCTATSAPCCAAAIAAGLGTEHFYNGCCPSSSSSSHLPVSAPPPNMLQHLQQQHQRFSSGGLTGVVVGQQQGFSSNKKLNEKVRPFAFRWMKKSKKN